MANSKKTKKGDQKGLIIVLEGCEGSGKTTQVEALEKRFKAMGREVITLREPGGTSISEQVRKVVLGRENTEMANTTEVLLFQAARAQIYHEVVIPAIKAGKVVLMDRSRDSSVVYQGMVRGFGREVIEELNDISTQKQTPDVTVLLDIDAEIGVNRRKESGKIDRLDLEPIDFHRNVRKAYLELVKENRGNRWLKVDGEQTIDEVTDEIWKSIKSKI